MSGKVGAKRMIHCRSKPYPKPGENGCLAFGDQHFSAIRHPKSSDRYVTVVCSRCGGSWQTAAAFVSRLPNFAGYDARKDHTNGLQL